jgi:Enoyl-(Acyl carrier protein) reductase
MRAILEARHPLGRLGTPEDIARAAGYFASDESLWTSGSVLTVDGDVMAQQEHRQANTCAVCRGRKLAQKRADGAKEEPRCFNTR